MYFPNIAKINSDSVDNPAIIKPAKDITHICIKAELFGLSPAAIPATNKIPSIIHISIISKLIHNKHKNNNPINNNIFSKFIHHLTNFYIKEKGPKVLTSSPLLFLSY